jgi:hypothetical protein
MHGRLQVYHYYHLWHPLDHVESAWSLAPAVPGLQVWVQMQQQSMHKML